MVPHLQKEILIYLSLGSNRGERLLNLKNAKRLISSQLGDIHSISGTYESEAWGYTSNNRYYNNCISAYTKFSPFELLEGIISIEAQMGRVRENNRYTDRIIDIDILFYGNEIIERPGIKIPHPRLSERRFVLVPLLEIAPDLVHPETHLTVREMIGRCKDRGHINPV